MPNLVDFIFGGKKEDKKEKKPNKKTGMKKDMSKDMKSSEVNMEEFIKGMRPFGNGSKIKRKPRKDKKDV